MLTSVSSRSLVSSLLLGVPGLNHTDYSRQIQIIGWPKAHKAMSWVLLKVPSCYKGVFFPLPHLPLYWLLGGQALGSVERLETFAIVNGDKSINKSINTIELNWKQA